MKKTFSNSTLSLSAHYRCAYWSVDREQEPRLRTSTPSPYLTPRGVAVF